MGRCLRFTWSVWRRPAMAAGAAALILVSFRAEAQSSQPRVGQEERFAIVRMGVGNEKRTGHTRGTPGDCISGQPVEVTVAIGSGALGNTVKGKAKCGRLIVVRPTSVSDPGGGGWDFVTASGNQVGGNPTCSFSYDGTEIPISAYVVTCRFF